MTLAPLSEPWSVWSQPIYSLRPANVVMQSRRRVVAKRIPADEGAMHSAVSQARPFPPAHTFLLSASGNVPPPPGGAASCWQSTSHSRRKIHPPPAALASAFQTGADSGSTRPRCPHTERVPRDGPLAPAAKQRVAHNCEPSLR